MKKLLLTVLYCMLLIQLKAQEFNPNIDKDSLFQVVLENLPIEKQEEFTSIYQETNEQGKEFLLMMLSMPRSSKDELVQNLESHQKEIFKLIKQYKKLVPDSLTVDIEFNSANNIVMMPASIDLKVYPYSGAGLSQWNLEYNSPELDSTLASLGWDYKTLSKIENLLNAANCTSILNGEITEIGFARSGMGKYYYMIFDSDLTSDQKNEYNDSCMYIPYNDKIVLMYGSGAIGSFCFPELR